MTEPTRFLLAPLLPGLPPSATYGRPLVAALAAVGLASCAPTVNLATPQPMKFDVAMRLDIYQKLPPKPKNEESALQIAYNRRARAPEIQQLKNDQVVGEDRNGYLAMHRQPTQPGYATYAQGVVNAENADRTVLYLASAQSQSVPLEKVEGDYAALWANRAYPGEWVQNENGTWTRK